MTQTNKIIISIVAVVILLGIYITFDRRSKEGEPINPNENISLATTTTNSTTGSGTKVITTGSGTYKIEQVPISQGNGVPQPIPDLNRLVTISTSAIVTSEAREYASKKILELQTKLKKNPADLGSWIYLGIYQKQAGDWEGAILSWKYAGRLAPNDYISLGNLGNLYGYFLKDNVQAEIYYKQAISKGPTQAHLYTQLAEVYRDLFKDLNKARAIVDQGLTKIPNDQNLLQLKASLQ